MSAQGRSQALIPPWGDGPQAPGGDINKLELDHLVVAAATLEQGAAWCEGVLGAVPQAGGRHALFGTHNRLLRLGGGHFPRAYLEIIAIDPEAPPPARPRWFGLDAPALQAQLQAAPRLLHWVARSTALEWHRAALMALGHRPGEPVRASRGTLSWQIVLRPDGRLEAGGALPTLIQWDGAHPADTLPPSGVELQSLQLHGLDERAFELIRMPGVARLAGAGPALRAMLTTPHGPVNLASMEEPS